MFESLKGHQERWEDSGLSPKVWVQTLALPIAVAMGHRVVSWKRMSPNSLLWNLSITTPSCAKSLGLTETMNVGTCPESSAGYGQVVYRNRGLPVTHLTSLCLSLISCKMG